MSTIMATTYLGDSVYGGVDRGRLFVCTDNGDGPENIIYFEPETFAALLRFAKREGL
jgi:hypothetical protein